MGVAKYTKGCCGWLIVLIIAALVVTAAVVAIKKRKPHHAEVLPVPGPPGAINQKYADALGVALQFFQVQKCTFPAYPCSISSLIALINSKRWVFLALSVCSSFFFFF